MILDKAYNLDELKALPSDELDVILRKETEKSNPDGNLIVEVVRILENRESEHMEVPEDVKLACDVVWDQYKENCEKITRAQKKNTAKPFGWISKVAVIAAILSIVIFAVPRIAGAENMAALVGRWTQTFFEFFDPAADDPIRETYVFETEHTDLRRVYNAVCDIGVTQPVVPMWVPEEYVLRELKISNTETATKVYAVLSVGDKSAVISIACYAQEGVNRYFKDEENVRPVEFGGVIHYTTSNDGAWTAAWTVGAAECSLTVADEEVVFIEMLRSIYNTEE